MATFISNYNNGKILEDLQNNNLESFVKQYNCSGQVNSYITRLKKIVEEYKNAN